MRRLVAALLIPAIVSPVVALAGPNRNATLVLHAIQPPPVPFCEIEDPCEPEPGQPQIEIVEPGEWHAIYVLVRNHDNMKCVQCAFIWPQDWVLLFSSFECLPTGIFDIIPTSPGPISGALSGCSLCVFGPSTAVVGPMYMIPGSHGCLEMIEAGYPFGTHIISCDDEIDPIDPANWGRVCVGPGGINTCVPAATPVRDAKWGSIKASFSN